MIHCLDLIVNGRLIMRDHAPESGVRASTHGDMAIDAIDLLPISDQDHRKQNVI
jgi:hypothetical protein